MKLKIISKRTYIIRFAKEKYSQKTYRHEIVRKFSKWGKKLGKEVEMQVGRKRKDKNRCKHQAWWKMKKQLCYGRRHDALTLMVNKRNIGKKSSQRQIEKHLHKSNNEQ